jgi:hypothetical protein
MDNALSDINRKPPDERRAVHQEQTKPLVVALEAFFREQRAQLSAKNDPAKAINYILNRWTRTGSHVPSPGGIPHRIQMSDFIHSVPFRRPWTKKMP